jgi:hypothetical protein
MALQSTTNDNPTAEFQTLELTQKIAVKKLGKSKSEVQKKKEKPRNHSRYLS